MSTVCLALFWHQHQPYYSDDLHGETLMPWVRLHGTKDYIGMALHLKEVPEFRCTINLVPSLLTQILAYTERGGSDRHLDVSRTPADALSLEDGIYLLDHFFMANSDNMIRPYPRYRELYSKRGMGIDSAESALPRYSERDLRDLQVWNNLTWFHPLLFEQDSDLKEFLKKGQGWTESEKTWLLNRQLEILGQIIPLHAELAQSGQVELTTTPFYHPILPLLWDKHSAREAMPGCPLSQYMDPYREDAVVQLERAVEFHEELFGVKPRGMWPSEGSVSQAILPAIANTGIKWIATDEEILAESTGGWVSRDSQGHVRNPEMLFRPWQLQADGRPLSIIFRDHALSDLIGFHYQRGDSIHAAHDLLGKVAGIGRACGDEHRPALVPIILDGENCWEYYKDGGVQFLRTLYQECARHEQVTSSTVSDYIEKHPPTDNIERLFAGSWISHNFAIWYGHQEDRDAWDRLHETRAFLAGKQNDKSISAETLARAWEEIYIAEGSDWFWWYGDDHSSALDELFDQLFRRHLRNVYELVGEPAPAELSRPITKTVTKLLHTQPNRFLPVRVDGRESFFEWVNAGKYESGSQRGTMTLVTEGLIQKLFFGFDPDRFLIRLDTSNEVKQDFKEVDEVRVHFIEPAGWMISVTGFEKPDHLKVSVVTPKEKAASRKGAAAIGEIFEMGVDLSILKLKEQDVVHFFVEVLRGSNSLDRAPNEGTIETTVPPKDFENFMWQA